MNINSVISSNILTKKEKNNSETNQNIVSFKKFANFNPRTLQRYANTNNVIPPSKFKIFCQKIPKVCKRLLETIKESNHDASNYFDYNHEEFKSMFLILIPSFIIGSFSMFNYMNRDSKIGAIERDRMVYLCEQPIKELDSKIIRNMEAVRIKDKEGNIAYWDKFDKYVYRETTDESGIGQQIEINGKTYNVIFQKINSRSSNYKLSFYDDDGNGKQTYFKLTEFERNKENPNRFDGKLNGENFETKISRKKVEMKTEDGTEIEVFLRKIKRGSIFKYLGYFFAGVEGILGAVYLTELAKHLKENWDIIKSEEERNDEN